MPPRKTKQPSSQKSPSIKKTLDGKVDVGALVDSLLPPSLPKPPSLSKPPSLPKSLTLPSPPTGGLDVNALVNSLMMTKFKHPKSPPQPDAVSTPTPSPTKGKRKLEINETIEITSSSEVDTIETSPISRRTAKKPRRDALNKPTSPVVKLEPAVELDAPRPKCKITKTAKAAAAEAMSPPSRTMRRTTAKIVRPVHVKFEESGDESESLPEVSEIMATEAFDSMDEEVAFPLPPTPNRIVVKIEQQTPQSGYVSDDDEDGGDENDGDESVTSDAAPQEAVPATSTPEDNGNNEACDEAPDVTLSAFDETVVTARYFQDPALYKIYAGLADSTPVQSIHSFGDDHFHLYSSFSALQNQLTRDEMMALLQCLCFEKAAPSYFNFARIDPGTVIIASGGGTTKTLKIAGTECFAIRIMPIRVTESFLYEGVQVASRGIVHKITGLPFCQEYRRDVSMWGTKLEFPPGGLHGSVGDLGVSFQTRWEKGPAFPEYTPVKKASSSKVTNTDGLVSIPCASPSKKRTNPFLGYSHLYETPVPVYDGRKTPSRPAFSFSQDDFDRLDKWPRFKGEIPYESLVAVGYTITTYVSGAGHPNASINLLFAILLALKA